MTEIRCKKCKRLLLKATEIQGEMKCPKCGYVQIIELGLVYDKKQKWFINKGLKVTGK